MILPPNHGVRKGVRGYGEGVIGGYGGTVSTGSRRGQGLLEDAMYGVPGCTWSVVRGGKGTEVGDNRNFSRIMFNLGKCSREGRTLSWSSLQKKSGNESILQEIVQRDLFWAVLNRTPLRLAASNRAAPNRVTTHADIHAMKERM